MFVWRLKNFIRGAAAIALALTALMLAQSMRISRFSELDGRRTFYLDSSSSQALMKEDLSFADLFRIKGESVAFECIDEQKTLAEITALYDAEILFEERAGGTVSYYCASAKWTDGVELGGVFVNLHIAFDGELCAVGAPLIFGGF